MNLIVTNKKTGRTFEVLGIADAGLAVLGEQVGLNVEQIRRMFREGFVLDTPKTRANLI